MIKILSFIVNKNNELLLFLDVDCTEYAYITFVKNEENIEYKWCKFEEFIEKIHWFGDKNQLIKVLEKALNNELYFKKEKIQRFNEF